MPFLVLIRLSDPFSSALYMRIEMFPIFAGVRIILCRLQPVLNLRYYLWLLSWSWTLLGIYNR